MPNQKKPCPFTPARLNELYWSEARSLRAIGGPAGVSDATVRRWLSEAGVTLRTQSEAVRAGWVTHGQTRAAAVSRTANRINTELAATRSADHLHTKAVARKISQAVLQTKARQRAAMLVTVHCEYCQEPLERLPSKAGARNYCDRNHMMLHRQSERRRTAPRKVCSVGGCDGTVCARGKCKMHYYQDRRAEGKT